MSLEEITAIPKLPARGLKSHKGQFGHVLVVAGSRGMAGAAVLCASAALRAGAGLVQLGTPAEIWPQVAVANPCYMTAPLPADELGRLSEKADQDILAHLKGKNVMALGPGLGRSPELSRLLQNLLPRITVPLVLDADGLNSFFDNPDSLGHHGGPLVITPHPGEMARLLKIDTARVQKQRRELAADFALKHRLIVVLKGHATVVTDGQKVFQNTTGNPGLATGGTGDVLSGIIAGLLAQGLETFAAAQLGVHVHGLAGDLARNDLGEVGMIASDLLAYLPKAFIGIPVGQ